METESELAEKLIARIENFDPHVKFNLDPNVTGAIEEIALWWLHRGKIFSPRVLTVHTLPDLGKYDNYFALGSSLANQAIDSGATLIVLQPAGAMHQEQIASRAIIGLLARKNAYQVSYQVAGERDQEYMNTLEKIRDTMKDYRDQRTDFFELAAIDSTGVISQSIGILLTAAVRKTPVITATIDHLAAALIAQRLARKSSPWWRHGSTSPDPGIQQAVERLDIPSGVPLHLSDNSGMGAHLSLVLLRELFSPRDSSE